MAELDIIKPGFDGCYDALKALSSRLHEATGYSLDTSADTSMTGEKEQACFDELVKMINDFAALVEETAQDVRLTQARYVLADQ